METKMRYVVTYNSQHMLEHISSMQGGYSTVRITLEFTDISSAMIQFEKLSTDYEVFNLTMRAKRLVLR